MAPALILGCCGHGAAQSRPLGILGPGDFQSGLGLGFRLLLRFDFPTELPVLTDKPLHGTARSGGPGFGFSKSRVLAIQTRGQTRNFALGLADLCGQPAGCAAGGIASGAQRVQYAARPVQFRSGAPDGLLLTDQTGPQTAHGGLLHVADGLRDAAYLPGSGSERGAVAAVQSRSQSKRYADVTSHIHPLPDIARPARPVPDRAVACD